MHIYIYICIIIIDPFWACSICTCQMVGNVLMRDKAYPGA